MDLNPQKSTSLKRRKSSIFSRFFSPFQNDIGLQTCKGEANAEVQELIDNLRQARSEWIDASTSFDYADDTEIVDYCTYRLKACELKYEYFLKKAKQRGIKVDFIENERAYSDRA